MYGKTTQTQYYRHCPVRLKADITVNGKIAGYPGDWSSQHLTLRRFTLFGWRERADQLRGQPFGFLAQARVLTDSLWPQRRGIAPSLKIPSSGIPDEPWWPGFVWKRYLPEDGNRNSCCGLWEELLPDPQGARQRTAFTTPSKKRRSSLILRDGGTTRQGRKAVFLVSLSLTAKWYRGMAMDIPNRKECRTNEKPISESGRDEYGLKGSPYAEPESRWRGPGYFLSNINHLVLPHPEKAESTPLTTIRNASLCYWSEPPFHCLPPLSKPLQRSFRLLPSGAEDRSPFKRGQDREKDSRVPGSICQFGNLHRQNIRKKLGLAEPKRSMLKTYLQSSQNDRFSSSFI